MSERSARHDFPLLVQGQGQKDVTHNEAMVAIDCSLHAAAETVATIEPPMAPEMGRAWLVGDSATADWAGHDGKLATWTEGGWRFQAFADGGLVWSNDEERLFCRVSGRWTPISLPKVPALAVPDVVGGVVVDVEARSAIAILLGRLRGYGLIG